MRGFSKAIIAGNVTRDPEVRTTPSGASVCSFSIAVNRTYRDANGTQQENVSFIDCSAWGKLGETIAQYSRRGTGMLVSGRIDQRSWTDQNGQKRSRVEIVVDDFVFAGGGNNGNSGNGGYNNNGNNGYGGGNFGSYGGNQGQAPDMPFDDFSEIPQQSPASNGDDIVPDDLPKA